MVFITNVSIVVFVGDGGILIKTEKAVCVGLAHQTSHLLQDSQHQLL